jgi:carbamoylphosphate synthase large subunit
MTDPELADATYIEPITPEFVAKIIEKERPDAVLPTMGGQTALNTALALFKDGTLDKFGVQMIGADADAIEKAEDRLKFGTRWTRSAWKARVRRSRTASMKQSRRLRQPASGDHPPQLSRLAAPAAASPTTARNSLRS